MPQIAQTRISRDRSRWSSKSNGVS